MMEHNEIELQAPAFDPERIRHFETLMQEAEQALSDYETALDRFTAAQDALAALNDYYGSRNWWADFDASEAGKLPADLPCGVLSEDGIWNLLSRNRELAEETRARMERLAAAPEKDA